MKKTIFSFVLIIHPLFANSMQLAALAAEYQPASLRDQCLDKVVHYLATGSSLPSSNLSCLPTDLAEPLLEKLKQLQTRSTVIRAVPGSAKMSPDGSKLLVDIRDDSPLKVYESSTGFFLFDLEDSLTSDGKVITADNRRFIPIKWSSTGKYIYANFYVPQNHWQHPIQYLYKIWDSTTGKRLYNIPFEPCGKLYFSPNDQFLLSKLMNHSLQVYHGATGVLAATLGPKTHGYWRYPQDPQNQWIMAYDEESDTELYDTQSFALAKKLPGQLKCFSADGDLIAIQTEEDTGRVQECHDDFGFPFNRTRSIMAPFACIYNRRFQSLAKIPFKGRLLNVMVISPCHQFLIVCDPLSERHYSIATKQQTQELEHHFDIDEKPISIFSTFRGDGTIKLEKRDKTTQITIAQDNMQRRIICPTNIRTVFYTENPYLVGLEYQCQIRYFLNIKTGVLIPCTISVKNGLFRYKPTKAICQGYFITKNGEQYELCKLTVSDKLLPCIQLLTKRLKKGPNQ